MEAISQMASGTAQDIGGALFRVGAYGELLLQHEAGLSPEGR